MGRKSVGLRFQASDTWVPSADVIRRMGGLGLMAGVAEVVIE